jgi:hypothetical protein
LVIDMNTFWLKIAGLAVAVIVGMIILASVFSGPESATETDGAPEPKPKTVYDVWEQDDKRLRADPQAVEPDKTSSTMPPPPEPRPVEPRQPQFKKLSMEDEVEALRLWEWVLNQRKMGRLPVMGYGQMVKTCREIIRRWPQSEYAFKAKRALADLPEQYHKMYNITKEEIDLGNFR